jgi:F420-dependent methylenetetrahydromethanopterin dehydrogenase
MIKGFHFGEKVKIKAPWGTKYGTMYSMNEQGIYYVQIDGEPMVGVVKEYLSSVDPNPKFQRHS